MPSVNDSFATDVKYGTLGEQFYRTYKEFLGVEFVLPLFDNYGPITFEDGKHPYVEGGDIFTHEIEEEKEFSRFSEVKTYANKSILKYGIGMNVTIPFELFSYESGSNQKRKTWRKGWLYQISHPREYNAEQVKAGRNLRAVTPWRLVFLFCESPEKTLVKPFVCIVFENFPALFDRLNEYAKDTLTYKDMNSGETISLDIKQWNLPLATDMDCWNQFSRTHQIYSNIWNVPFKEIKQFATVYMIDDKPRCDTPFEESRLNALIEASDGRHISTEKMAHQMNFIKKRTGTSVHPTTLSFPSYYHVNDEYAKQSFEQLKELVQESLCQYYVFQKELNHRINETEQLCQCMDYACIPNAEYENEKKALEYDKRFLEELNARIHRLEKEYGLNGNVQKDNTP